MGFVLIAHTHRDIELELSHCFVDDVLGIVRTLIVYWFWEYWKTAAIKQIAVRMNNTRDFAPNYLNYKQNGLVEVPTSIRKSIIFFYIINSQVTHLFIYL